MTFLVFFFAEKIRVLCGVNHENLKQLFHVLKLIREAFSKPHNPSSFKKFKPKPFMLCFGGKSCFLMEKPKVGNRDQMELNTSGQSVKF